MAKKATNVVVREMTGSPRTLFATWDWNKADTENYKVQWKYATGDGVMFIGSDSTEDYKQSTYTFPENATKVTFRVKPVAKKVKKNKKEVAAWPAADWSTITKASTFTKGELAPATPSPNVSLDELDLKVEFTNVDTLAKKIQIQILQDHKTLIKNVKKDVTKQYLLFKTTVSAGHTYSVRCRAIGNGGESEWTEYTDVTTRPSAPSQITDLRATSDNMVYIAWTKVSNADSYNIQWTTNRAYFDSGGAVNSSSSNVAYAYLDVTKGDEYFFRVQAVNNNGESGWSPIKSLKCGTTPTAPTTWSSANKAVVGEPLNLYWVHNSEDGSEQTEATLEWYASTGEIDTVTIYGGTCDTPDTTQLKQVNVPNLKSLGHTIIKVKMAFSDSGAGALKVNDLGIYPYYTEDPSLYYWADGATVVFRFDNLNMRWVILENDASANTTSYSIDTTQFPEGTTLRWKVATCGVTGVYGPYSVERDIELYAQPTLSLILSTVNEDGYLESFPLDIEYIAEPEVQKPVGYHFSVIANESYETVDDIGNVKMVTAGEEIFSENLDLTISHGYYTLLPSMINLDNGVLYTIRGTVAMNSGLTATETAMFTPAWADDLYDVNARIAIDMDELTASINPRCEDEAGNLVSDVYLSVYRREYDGTFTEIEKNIPNMDGIFVTDPHPALDYARYRIVAISNTTGGVSYYDLPAEPVGEVAAVIQWAEDWSNFATEEEDELEQPTWAGSMLKLPYNLDLSDSNSPEVELVNYIGRKHPVSYYGTQLGTTASLNVEIDKEDEETLYALRRLQIWMGDVYFREPSGSGYWANVTVQFNQTHCEVTIPVTITITRVDGGV